jgi:hypothetical protein
MGNLVMPKNSAEFSEMKAVLKVYYESNDWIENSVFIDKMKDLLGLPHQEPQAYTKKTQIPSYFGFTIWEDLSSNQSRRKITESGKRFYEALLSEDIDSIQKELMHSLEHQTFGRNVCGCGSDSDIEPPQVFIKCVLALGFLTRQEYGYILWQLDEEKETLFDLVTRIAVNRIKDNLNYTAIPPKFGDAKPITALLNWNFLDRDGKIGSQDKIVINKNVLIKYIDRLQELRISNAEIQKFTVLNDSGETNVGINLTSINKIFYGAPGTGKSHKVNEFTKGKENRTERVTFHPEYDYNSFVGGYKPTMSGDDIRYEFVPQTFTKVYVNAWNDLDNDYYLVIEEINRGNCAEIFGDIFQLLDRSNQYEITPSKELGEYLRKHLSSNVLNNGEKLLLPPNLNILATMNTSDQSLFPMDSAFKRRWDWEYLPINYESTYIDHLGEVKENESYTYRIEISDNQSVSWLEFIKAVNGLIKNNDNLGMDKCIGNYFIKTQDAVIDIETFINKAIFYLWNDVFKDELDEYSIFKNKTTYEDFFPIKTLGVEKVLELMDILQVEITSKSE